MRLAEQTYPNDRTVKHFRKPLWVQIQHRDDRHDLRAVADSGQMQRMEHGPICSFVGLGKVFDTVSHDGLWTILARLGCLPEFLTILRRLLWGQQGQVKHNRSLSGSFPIPDGVKQGCVLAPKLFSVFLSIMLYDAKEDLPDGIYIRLRADALSSTLGVSSLARKPLRNSTLNFCLPMTAPFSPTRRKLYSTSSTSSLMQQRTSASPSA